MERWHWPCWEGFIRLVCAAMGIPHSVLRAWEKLPSIPLALPGWAGLSSLSAGSSGHLCCPLPRGSTRGVIRVTQAKALPQNATFTKKSPSALPLGWEFHPSYLCPAPGPWLCHQSLDLLWNADPSSPHTAPNTRIRAQPTAQTHKAQSSLPPVTSPRSVGQSWPLPTLQVVSQCPPSTQGHPKPVTHHGPPAQPHFHVGHSQTPHCSSHLCPSSQALPSPSLPAPNTLNNIKHLMAINTL